MLVELLSHSIIIALKSKVEKKLSSNLQFDASIILTIFLCLNWEWSGKVTLKKVVGKKIEEICTKVLHWKTSTFFLMKNKETDSNLHYLCLFTRQLVMFRLFLLLLIIYILFNCTIKLHPFNKFYILCALFFSLYKFCKQL